MKISNNHKPYRTERHFAHTTLPRATSSAARPLSGPGSSPVDSEDFLAQQKWMEKLWSGESMTYTGWW